MHRKPRFYFIACETTCLVLTLKCSVGILIVCVMNFFFFRWRVRCQEKQRASTCWWHHLRRILGKQEKAHLHENPQRRWIPFGKSKKIYCGRWKDSNCCISFSPFLPFFSFFHLFDNYFILICYVNYLQFNILNILNVSFFFFFFFFNGFSQKASILHLRWNVWKK